VISREQLSRTIESRPPQESRQPLRVVLFFVLVSAVVLFATYMVNSHAGLRSPPHAPDWVSHVTIADLLTEGEDPHLYRPQIGPVAMGPKLGHYLAAQLSKATGLPPIRTVEIIVWFCLILSVVLAAARSVWVVFCVAQNRAARIVGWLIAVAALYFFVRIGAGFYGQVGFVNFFYAQAVATAVALIALSILQLTMARGGLAALSALSSMPLVTLLLVKIHFVPAVWFAAAGSIIALSLDRPLLHRLAIAGALGLLGAILVFTEPATRAMVELPQVASAVLNLRLWSGLFQLNTHPEMLVGGLATLAALIGIVTLIEQPASLRFRLFNMHAGALALLGVGSGLLLILLFRDGDGYYALAKFVYLFAAESVLLLGHLGAIVLNRFGETPIRSLWLAPALLLAIFVQQRSAPPYKRDQTLLIEMRQALREARARQPQPTPFPLHERLSGTDRLYLFTSAMGQPKDRRAMQLLQPNFETSLEAARESLPPSLIPRIVPGWTGQTIHLRAIPDPSPLISFGRWGDTGVDGRIIHPPAAHLAFRLTGTVAYQRLCLRVLTPNLKEAIHSTFASNGKELKVEQFRPRDDRVIELPLPEIHPHGDCVLSILVSAGPIVTREKPTVSLRSLWLAERCSSETSPRGGLDFSGASKYVRQPPAILEILRAKGSVIISCRSGRRNSASRAVFSRFLQFYP
jgi:hypothetical protein